MIFHYNLKESRSDTPLTAFTQKYDLVTFLSVYTSDEVFKGSDELTKVVLFSVTIFMIFLSGCSINYMPTYSSTISKGINIGCALEAPEEGEWGIIIEERFFDLIVERGFESVRLPIRWSAHTPNFPPYTIDNIFLLRVEEVVQQALERGLKVIINVHHFEELMINPDAQEEKFYSIWEQITQHFKDYPDTLYFELLNEPEGLLNTDKWNTMQLEAINRIRAINKDRWIIITGAPGGLSEALDSMQLPEDIHRIMATFHFYEPYLFTHQGAPWLGSEFQTVGIQWPGPPEIPVIPVQAAQDIPEFAQWFEQYNTLDYAFNPAGPRPITQELERARDWSWQTGIPILMGEFGTYNMIDETSRANWTTFVYQKAMEYGIPWLLWGFVGTFGVYDLETEEWNEAIIGNLFGTE